MSEAGYEARTLIKEAEIIKLKRDLFLDRVTPEPLASIIRNELLWRKTTGFRKLALAEKKLRQPKMTLKQKIYSFIKRLFGGWQNR